jgi:hypothetical protein
VVRQDFDQRCTSKRLAGQVRPLIDPSPFTLDTVGAAQQRAESGAAVGKVVLDIAPTA